MPRQTNLRRPRRNNRQHDRSYNPLPNSPTVSAVTVGSPNTKLNVTFSGEVFATGGVYQLNANSTLPTAQTQTAPNVIQLDYAAGKTAAQTYAAPAQDPALRTGAGGYVLAKNGVLA